MKMIRSVNTIRFLSTQKPTERNGKKLYKRKICTTKPPAEGNTALPFEDVQAPKNLLVIGDLQGCLKKIDDMHGLQAPVVLHSRSNEQFDDIACLRGIIFWKPMVLLYKPEKNTKVYRNKSQWAIRNAMNRLKYLRKVHKDKFEDDEGLSTENDEQWIKLRSLVNHILVQPKALKQDVARIDDTASQLVDNTKFFVNNSTKQQALKYFLSQLYKYIESVGKLVKRFGCPKRYEKLNPETQYLLYSKSLDPMFDYRPVLWQLYSTPEWKRFVYITNYLVGTFKHYISEEDRRRLVNIILKVAIVVIVNMLTPGTEISGKVIGATLYYLVTDKNIQNKLWKPLHKWLLLKYNTAITKEVINQGLKEVIRLATIGVGNANRTAKTSVLFGYQIPEWCNPFKWRIDRVLFSRMLHKCPDRVKATWAFTVYDFHEDRAVGEEDNSGWKLNEEEIKRIEKDLLDEVDLQSFDSFINVDFDKDSAVSEENITAAVIDHLTVGPDSDLKLNEEEMKHFLKELLDKMDLQSFGSIGP